MDKKKCTALIKEFIILPTKSLGQNFLVDEDAANRIVDASGACASDRVLEIGPGLGALTEILSSRASYVYAVEIDTHLIEALRSSLSDKKNVEIINADFLKVPRASFGNHDNSFCVVSNIPYYAMTPIMLKLFREWEDAKTMTFTVEDDACDRIFAEPGTKQYGPLSVLSALYGKKEKLFLLSSKSFHPAPHTTSAVIRLTSDGTLQTAPSVLFPLVHASFAQRRKTLVNVLSSSGLFPDGKKQVIRVLEETGISVKQRAEELSAHEYLHLARQMLKI